MWCAPAAAAGQIRAQLQPAGKKAKAKKAPRVSLAQKATSRASLAEAASRQLDDDKAKDDAENHKSVWCCVLGLHSGRRSMLVVGCR